jgi:hypothetical protein
MFLQFNVFIPGTMDTFAQAWLNLKRSKKMRYGWIILGLILMSNACERDDNGGSGDDSFITLSLNLDDRAQQIEAFGASDAWSTQFIGSRWPVEKKEQAATFLFSRETDADGDPLGIGLSGWRFNIGAGSTEQGPSSQISDEWRRAECFLNADGSYNWEKHEGQRWFLGQAAAHGVEDLTAFVNSPPVHYTKNGYAWSDGGSSANLKSAHFVDYARFLATVIDEVQQREGITFDCVSPVNEPQWDWDNKGQEGSPFRNDEIAGVTRLLSSELISKGLSTEIEITDAGQIKYIYTAADRPERGNQAYAFFDPASGDYVGDLSNVSFKIAGHSYYSTYPVSHMIDERKKLVQGLEAVHPELDFWQTEYCILEGNNEINGNGRDLGIDPAIYMARLIHYDLTVANSSTWYWWLAISPYDYKDGLVYTDYDTSDGKVYDSKLLWALGNYSRFINPGMYRYGIIRSDNKLNEMAGDGLMVSGYSGNDGNEAVYVMVNYADHAYPVKVKTTASNEPVDMLVYTTSAISGENLKRSVPGDVAGILSIPARSVVTVIASY